MNISKPIYSRLHNIVTGHIKSKIVYVHIPKCGGTSISSAIMNCYKTFQPGGGSGLVNINAGASLKAAVQMEDHDIYDDDFHHILKQREYLLLYFMNLPSTRFIHGHTCFSNLAYETFKDNYVFITLLRDPVKRWISAFFYNRYRDDCEWKIAEDLADYLESKRAKANGYEYVKKLVGEVEGNTDYASDEMIEKAKKNLEKFALVGFLDDLHAFRDQFRARFGATLRIRKINQGPKSADFIRSAISEETEKRITEICRPDLMVYQHAIGIASNSHLRP